MIYKWCIFNKIQSSEWNLNVAIYSACMIVFEISTIFYIKLRTFYFGFWSCLSNHTLLTVSSTFGWIMYIFSLLFIQILLSHIILLLQYYANIRLGRWKGNLHGHWIKRIITQSDNSFFSYQNTFLKLYC